MDKDKQHQINFNKYPLPDRKRHHIHPNNYVKQDELKFVPNYYPTKIDMIDWSEVFINAKKPNKIDIGCGRGLFTLTNAEQCPNDNILGLEIRQWCCDWLRNYISSEKIQNCGVVHYNLLNGLQFIETQSIDEVYYLFPDPWVKKKHNKRRAFNQEFLNMMERILSQNGKLYLASDLEEVHQYHLETLQDFGKFDFKIVENDDDWNLPRTNKELFCIRENIPYYCIIAIKQQ